MRERAQNITRSHSETTDCRSGVSVEDIAVAEVTPRAAKAGGSWVGTCTDIHHPVLRGRIEVRWSDHRGQLHTRWLPTLASIAVRAGDRVVCDEPVNFDEPVVMGVLDGFTPRPERPTQAGASIALRLDEHLAITDEAGNTLVELRGGGGGPVVKVLHAATTLDLPGKLSIRADAIELAARTGDLRIEARGDVRVNGDFIRLNGR